MRQTKVLRGAIEKAFGSVSNTSEALRRQYIGHPGSVFGQIVASNVLRAACKHNNNPMTFIDPKAGEGINRVARKTTARPHVADGADLLWELEKEPTTRRKRNRVFRDYIKILKHHNIDEDGFLHDQIRYVPSGGELCRQFMKPHDHLIMAEEDEKQFERLAELYGDDPQITLVNEKPGQAMLHNLPPRYPNGFLYYEAPPKSEPEDFIRYLNRFPYATICIAYTMDNMQDKIMTSVTEHEGFEESSPKLRNAHRPVDTYRRVARRGYRNILGAELKYKGNAPGSPFACGVLIANAPIGFEDELEVMLPQIEELFDGIRSSDATYFWASKPPLWYTKRLANSKKLPWDHSTSSNDDMLETRHARTRKNAKWRKSLKDNQTVMDRMKSKMDMLEKSKIRRRYVGEFNPDSDPADPVDRFLPRLKKAYRWKKPA